MKVYVIYSFQDNDSEVEKNIYGVYKNKEKAKKLLDTLNSTENEHEWYDIESFNVED